MARQGMGIYNAVEQIDVVVDTYFVYYGPQRERKEGHDIQSMCVRVI